MPEQGHGSHRCLTSTVVPRCQADWDWEREYSPAHRGLHRLQPPIFSGQLCRRLEHWIHLGTLRIKWSSQEQTLGQLFSLNNFTVLLWGTTIIFISHSEVLGPRAKLKYNSCINASHFFLATHIEGDIGQASHLYVPRVLHNILLHNGFQS